MAAPTLPKDLWSIVANFADERTLLRLRLASQALHAICARQLRRDPRVRRWLDLRRFLDSDDPRPTKRIQVRKSSFIYTDTWFWQNSEGVWTEDEGPIAAPGYIYLSGAFCALGNAHVVRDKPLRIEEHTPPDPDTDAFEICDGEGDPGIFSLDRKLYTKRGSQLRENGVIVGAVDMTDAEFLGGSAHGVWIQFRTHIALCERGVLKSIVETPHGDSATSSYFILHNDAIYDRAGRKFIRRGIPLKNVSSIYMNLDNDWITFDCGPWGDDEGTAIRYSSPD